MDYRVRVENQRKSLSNDVGVRAQKKILYLVPAQIKRHALEVPHLRRVQKLMNWKVLLALASGVIVEIHVPSLIHNLD